MKQKLIKVFPKYGEGYKLRNIAGNLRKAFTLDNPFTLSES